MSSMAVSGIVFASVFGGTIFGLFLRRMLPPQHLSTESKDVVKLGMGLTGSTAEERRDEQDKPQSHGGLYADVHPF